MASKKKMILPEGHCPLCFNKHDPSYLIHPEIPEYPNVIFIGDYPTEEELRKAVSEGYGRPFVGRSGRLLRQIAKSAGARPIILYARQCYAKEKPTKEQIKANREMFLPRILEQYPNLPIVSLGSFAASYLYKGRHSDTSAAGKVIEQYDRPCVATYSADYFLSSRNSDIHSHIETTIRASVITPKPVSYISGFPTQVSNITLDIESSSTRYPWYDSHTYIIGIKEYNEKVSHVFKVSDLTREYISYLNSHVKLVIGHNLMFDLIHMAYLGVTFPNAYFWDTMIYHKNLFPNEPEYGLKQIAKKYYGYHHWDAWFHAILHEKTPLESADYGKLCLYNAYDLLATEELYKNQGRECKPFLLEMDFLRYMAKMTMNGMKVDKTKLAALSESVGEELEQEELEARYAFSLGKDFNFNSPIQLRNYLNKIISPPLEDTSKSTLKARANDHPFIGHLLKIKNLSKLRSTSLAGLTEFLDESDCIHSAYSVHGAETGRGTSSQPNLQNTDPRVRNLFISRYSGGKLLYSDLSSLEYRLIAHIANERKLITMFNNDEDIHLAAFKGIFNRDAVDDKERKIGKTNNYLGVYGGGYSKFLAATGLPENDDSKKSYDKVTKLYPKINEWKETVIRQLRSTGKIRNLFGRVREFNLPVTMDDEREGVNWIIQSSGHDILEIYLMEVDDRIEKAGLNECLLISEVHDSFTRDCPLEQVDEAEVIVDELAKDLNPLIEQCFGVKMKVTMKAEVYILDQWE